jgi:hypothetical protein
VAVGVADAVADADGVAGAADDGGVVGAAGVTEPAVVAGGGETVGFGRCVEEATGGSVVSVIGIARGGS